MAEFDSGLPSIRHLQGWIQDQRQVELKLLTNDRLIGTLVWQDPHCLCLRDGQGEQTLIWRQTLAYIKPQS